MFNIFGNIPTGDTEGKASDVVVEVVPHTNMQVVVEEADVEVEVKV